MMTTQSNLRLVSSLQAWSQAASMIVILVGGVVLVGWMADIPSLKSILPGLVTMKANTALTFILIGWSLRLLQAEAPDQRMRPIMRGLAFAVALVGLLTLSQYLFGWNLGIDELLFKEPPGAIATSHPGRMAPNTALNFLLLGSTLLLLDVEISRSRRPADILVLTAALVSVLALAGYAYGAKELYGFAAYTSMAIHTIVTFLVLCVGILFARPESGIMAVVTSESIGGVVARRMLLIAVAIPVVLGWLTLQGQHVGLYDTEFSLSLIMVASIFIFAIVIWRTAESLERTDMERKRAEEMLLSARDELEMRVQERTAKLEEANEALQTEIIERKRAEEERDKVFEAIRVAVSQLSSTSSEILAATTQQVSGTAEEATAVQETSTTVDEVKQTVRLSAQKARAVTEVVQKTAQVSQDGRTAVEASMKGMQETKARMEAIAERILALSEQGQAIGEIIASVNDLAERSNLLAVNAAIEAAKAGEVGKGFAVVAAEVKALAEQSKQATAQVRSILNEIQRATQAAVMATEQGVKVSEAGERTVGRAGESIRLMAESMTESAQAAQQIQVSVQQAVIGVDQIAVAMRNIQQASTQNMASTRQVEQAAQHLNALAQRLTTLITGNGAGSRSALSHHAKAEG